MKKTQINQPKVSVRARLRALESIAHLPMVESIRIEAIEKQIQELYDKFEIIEKELIEPLRRLRDESQSD